MKISMEDGRKDGLPPQTAPVVGTVIEVSESERLRLANLERLQNLIDKAMKGQLPRERELKDHEPQKLNEVHFQWIFDRATGMTGVEIAEKYGYSSVYVNVILAHPDAQFILSTILSMSADKLTDMTARLQHLAPEALNVKVELMRQAKTEALKDKAASDILALAGYGGKTGTSITINNQKNTGPSLVLPEKAAKGLVEALLASQRVKELDYSQYLAGSQGEVISAEHRQLSDGQQTTPGQSDSEGGASPSPSPEQLEPDFEFIEGYKVAEAEAQEFRQALDDEKEARVA